MHELLPGDSGVDGGLKHQAPWWTVSVRSICLFGHDAKRDGDDHRSVRIMTQHTDAGANRWDGDTTAKTTSLRDWPLGWLAFTLRETDWDGLPAESQGATAVPSSQIGGSPRADVTVRCRCFRVEGTAVKREGELIYCTEYCRGKHRATDDRKRLLFIIVIPPVASPLMTLMT